MLPRLTVNLDGPTARHGRVFLDGVDISSGLKKLVIRLDHEDITTAEIVLDVGELEIDAQTLAVLQANVKVMLPAEPEGPLCFGEVASHA
jgi:hypothetical protein